MSITRTGPDDSIPIVVGWQYWLAPNASSNNWVEVVEIIGRKVRYVGVYPTIADQTVLLTQFDDLVRDFSPRGLFLMTEDDDFITTEDGLFLFTEVTDG